MKEVILSHKIKKVRHSTDLGLILNELGMVG